MEKAIRVQVLGREYALRVREEDESLTRSIAAYVSARMRSFQQAHPEQPELTAAVITSLAIAEELFTTREQHEAATRSLDERLEALRHLLDDALGKAHGDEADDEASHDVPEAASLSRTES